MSVHNQAEFLETAIESILKQKFTNFELIIINDASDKKTTRLLKQIKDKRVRLFHNQKRLGLAKSLNRALSKAQGQYIARMDADDVAFKNKLKSQLKYLASHPDAAGCGTAATLINNKGEKIGTKQYPQNYHQIKKVIMRFSPFIHPTIMLRREVIDELGGYDERLNGAEDYDLWLRLVAKYPMANLPGVLFQYRVNPRGVSWKSLKHTELQALRARIKALKEYGYPSWQAIYLIKPSLSFLIPGQLKKLMFNIR